MTDNDALARIHELVAEEKTLRQELQHGEISESEEHQRLRRVETELDQCWDLLRQRRALRETGGDPREAAVRPPTRSRATWADRWLRARATSTRSSWAAAQRPGRSRVPGPGRPAGTAAGAAGARRRCRGSAQIFDGVDARLSRYAYLVSLLPTRIVDDLGATIRLARRPYSSYTPIRPRQGVPAC